MVHHTYANLLSEELGMQQKALVHRKIALGMTEASWTFQGMANTLVKLDRNEDAEPYYAKAAERDPDDARHWSQWGSCLFKLKRYSAAMEKYSKASELDPESAYYRQRIADCLLDMGRRAEGIALYKELLAENPDNKLVELSLKAAQGAGTVTRIKSKGGATSFGRNIMEAQNFRKRDPYCRETEMNLGFRRTPCRIICSGIAQVCVQNFPPFLDSLIEPAQSLLFESPPLYLLAQPKRTRARPSYST